MNAIIFIISLISATLLMLLSLVPLFKSSFVFFPPPSKDSWQYKVFWLLFRLMFIGLVILSFTSYNSAPVFNQFVRFLVWLPVLLLGFGLATYLSSQLGWANAHGEAKGLMVSGCYKWSRNPIYVSSLFGMLGWGLFVNSVYVYLLLGLWAIMYLIAPFVEERWLEKTYGQDFLLYKSRVPRFLGIPSKN